VYTDAIFAVCLVAWSKRFFFLRVNYYNERTIFLCCAQRLLFHLVLASTKALRARGRRRRGSAMETRRDGVAS